MKKTIRCLSLGLSLCCLLGSCSKAPEAEENSAPPVTSETRSVAEEWGAALARVEEMLEAQAQLNARTERRLGDLEETAAGSETGESAAQVTPAFSPESDFRCSENGGGITIIGYVGHDTVVRIPETIGDLPVVAIGEKAFQSMNVVSVEIPSGVAVLDWFSFAGCYRLTSVTLPASVTEIRYGAFERCPASLTFYCPSDSYAAAYAVSYGFPVHSPEP